jgi:hypothetical protein
MVMEIWEEYDLAFHYTTQSGLMGILQSQMLHATHFAFLNDYNEMYELKPRLFQIVLPIAKSVCNDVAEAKRRAKHIVDLLYRVTLGLSCGTKFFQPFVASFCGHEDYEKENGQLSQWRAYGKESGYAIAFDVEQLTESLKLEWATFAYDGGLIADVVYTNDDESKFTKEFDNLIAAVHEDVPKLLKNEEGPYNALNKAFMISIPRYKHRGFAEEKEIRIVQSPTHQTLLDAMAAAGDPDRRQKKEIKFRSSMAPYIELFQGVEKKLPIKKIVVGPHAEKLRRAERLKTFLDLNSLDIEVQCSEIPFV